MKHLISICYFSLILLAGCERPPDITLPPDVNGDNEIEVTSITAGDGDYSFTQIDSLAVLPGEQIHFAGRLVVNRITYDFGNVVRTVARSHVVFEDRDREVRLLGRRVGFHGVNLGQVLLDGSPMLRVAHRIPIRRLQGDTTILAGFEYIADLSSGYQPSHTYTWQVTPPDPLIPFSLSIRSPENLTVESPRGGSVVIRENDLPVRWSGGGEIRIIVSGFDPASRETRPILQIRPRVNRGRLVLPSRVLRILPERFRHYAFTFVVANRTESDGVGNFSGRVLIQSASVYTSYVELR